MTLTKRKVGRPPLPKDQLHVRLVTFVPKALFARYQARWRELGYSSLSACLAAVLTAGESLAAPGPRGRA